MSKITARPLSKGKTGLFHENGTVAGVIDKEARTVKLSEDVIKFGPVREKLRQLAINADPYSGYANESLQEYTVQGYSLQIVPQTSLEALIEQGQ